MVSCEIQVLLARLGHFWAKIYCFRHTCDATKPVWQQVIKTVSRIIGDDNVTSFHNPLSLSAVHFTFEMLELQVL